MFHGVTPPVSIADTAKIPAASMVSCEAGAETETPVCPLGTSGQTPVPAGAGVASMTALASPDSSTVVKRQFGSWGESHPPSSARQHSPRPAAEIEIGRASCRERECQYV